MDSTIQIGLTMIGTFVISGAIFLVMLLKINKKEKPSESVDSVPVDGGGKKTSDSSKLADKKSAKRNRLSSATSKSSKDVSFSHPWLAVTLKGHSNQVLDIDASSNGKYFASCSLDRQLMLWNAKDLSSKEIKSVKASVELDHAKFLKFSPDCKALVVCLGGANQLAVYKLTKKEGSTGGGITSYKIIPADGIEFPALHAQDIINIGISCTGKFIMSASCDTTMIVWDLHGSPLKTIDTVLGNNNYAVVSPCGRFVACSGFTPDVKIWEVTFGKSGEFQDVSRAFVLTGHTSGVYSFAFNADSTMAVSASKDGTWKLWDTNIEYKLGQQPYLLRTGNLDILRDTPALLAMAPSGNSFVLAAGSVLRVYESHDGGLSDDATLRAVHAEPITALCYTSDGAYFATAGDRHIRVLHNVPGWRAMIAKLEEQLHSAGQSNATHRQRLQDLVNDAKQTLKAILDN